MRTKAEWRDGASSSADSDQATRQNVTSRSGAFADRRTQAVTQRRQSDIAHAGPRLDEQRMIVGAIQRRADGDTVGPNRTGLPDQLKAGIESLSGISMDGVKVHFNSSEPAQFSAHAYAQGTDIHIAPGQEQHLPHEAWHVVQQAQGRVKPTLQMKGGTPINDNVQLEAEADVMGDRALAFTGEPVSSEVGAAGSAGPSAAQLSRITPKGVNGLTHLVELTEEGSLYSEDFLENERDEVVYGNILLVDEDAALYSRRGNNQEENSELDRTADATNRWVQAVQVDRKELDDGLYIREEMLLTPDEDSPEMLRSYAAVMINNQGMGLSKTQEETAIDFLLFLNSKPGISLSRMKLTNSSGSSLVVLPEGKPYIVQHFVSEGVYQNIRDTYLEQLPEDGATFQLRVDSDELEEHYVTNPRLFDYITRATQFVDEYAAIQYEKIQPLNSLFSGADSHDQLQSFVQANAAKIAVDITIAIKGLAFGGLSQGDVRLDNVGIKNGKFVLFDYDGFKPDAVRHDLETLNQSLVSYGARPFTLAQIAERARGESLAEKVNYILGLEIDW